MYRCYGVNPGTCTFRLQIRIENEYPLLGKGHRQAITPKLYLSVFFDVFLKIEVQNLTFYKIAIINQSFSYVCIKGQQDLKSRIR